MRRAQQTLTRRPNQLTGPRWIRPFAFVSLVSGVQLKRASFVAGVGHTHCSYAVFSHRRVEWSC